MLILINTSMDIMRQWIMMCEDQARLAEANHLDRPYYHGTTKQQDARRIMEQGLRPPSVSKPNRSNLQAMTGYVYLTPHLRYAINYAIGFHMMESDRLKLRIPYEGNKSKLAWLIRDGRYGYVFVVMASSITNDLAPDEDEVGSLYDSATRGEIHFYLEDFLPQSVFANAESDPAMLTHFRNEVERIVSQATRDKLKNSWRSDKMIGWASKVGKIAIRKLDPTLKTWLVQIGCHVGHPGTVYPDECWQFDRTKIGWLEEDASNFFDLAQRIWRDGRGS